MIVQRHLRMWNLLVRTACCKQQTTKTIGNNNENNNDEDNKSQQSRATVESCDTTSTTEEPCVGDCCHDSNDQPHHTISSLVEEHGDQFVEVVVVVTKPGQKKTVRFDEKLPAQIPPGTVEEAPLEELWYSRDDFRRFGTAHALMAKGLMRCKPHYSKALKETYKACCHTSTNNNKRPLPTLSFSSTDSDDEEEVVGLEALCLDQSDHKRVQLIQSLVKAAAGKRPQRRRRQQQQHSDAEETAERIRRACEKLTQPSRLFARHVAQAHAAATTPLLTA